MRALGAVAGVREHAQLVAARIGAAVKRTAYAANEQCATHAFHCTHGSHGATLRRLAVVGDGNLWCVIANTRVLANTRGCV